MAINTECTSPSPPPPRIGKIGPYTVFMTPPPTPKSGSTELPPPVQLQPVQTPPVQVVDKSCPVWSPPMQYDKPSHSSFGFFWNAVAKVQYAHASLDEQVAYWFGLNQSKYQWALDDYYESKNIVWNSEVEPGLGVWAF
ncbi:hypothetical protein KY290_030687 [Solanum tuberosum]|uniref:Hydroxyproline-rich glycoprotein family protein n=1 Tax=Solanum tuberosum TaxID=4113 RepID=A0ABQ7U7Y9_SOLTU|nr:hypothetical protein KY285_029756 [Solanum tuberosum]KAH0742694.1 hypothetical protein KY290_030687 [Solanum tuberosum]